MALKPGDRFGPYEILSPLGSGGMGEVYRAQDTRLGRAVAVKVLAAAVMGSAEHRARFEREARAIAALNHPNICTLHDIGREGDSDYLVMELVEGETLASRLARGPLPLAELLRVGSEVARALARAHQSGIVHRDLKPGNIMLARTGAKLMDFGLARSVIAGHKAPDVSQLSTQTAPITGEGRLLGTFQYMAPEQLEGREVDARTDIWALGVTLYEMATGRRPFEGASTASVISSIMREEPRPILEFSPVNPASLDRLIRTCLAKAPDERWQSAADLARELGHVAEPVASITGPRTHRMSPMTWGIAVVLGTLLVAFVLRGTGEGDRSQHLTSSRIVLPNTPQDFLAGSNVALAPDGSAIAVTMPDSADRWHLIIRPMDSDTYSELRCPNGAYLPFWSPDGREIAYATDEDKLVRRTVEGGPEQTICSLDAYRGGAWGPNGLILFAGGHEEACIFSVPVSGGELRRVTTLDTLRKDHAHLLPAFLPDGIHFLYTVQSKVNVVAGRVEVGDVHGGAPRRLMEVQGAARVSRRGDVLYLRDRTLMVRRISPDGSRYLNEPVAVPGMVERKTIWTSADACGSIADGLIVFPMPDARPTAYHWSDRQGVSGPVLGTFEPEFTTLDVAPDLQHAIIKYAAGIETNIRVVDLALGREARLTAQPWKSRQPSWYPDSRRIMFQYIGPDGAQVTTVAIDSPGVLEQLFPLPVGAEPTGMSSDGGFIALDRVPLGNGGPVIADRAASWAFRRFLPDGETGFNAVFTSDGKFLVYAFDAAGKVHIASRRFPSGDERQVLTQEPVGASASMHRFWLTDRELMYVAEDNRTLRAAPLRPEVGRLTCGPARSLFQLPADVRGVGPSADGSRFLLGLPVGPRQRLSLALVQNWEQLRKP